MKVMDVASQRVLLDPPGHAGRRRGIQPGRAAAGGERWTRRAPHHDLVRRSDDRVPWLADDRVGRTRANEAPSGVAISDNDRLEAVSSFCGVLRIGHTGWRRPFETFNQHEKIGGRIAFNPAGTQLALVAWDSSATVISVATDKPALELLGHTRFVNDVTYSPVGDLMATTSFDNTMRIWNASTGQLFGPTMTIRSPPCRCSVPTAAM